MENINELFLQSILTPELQSDYAHFQKQVEDLSADIDEASNLIKNIEMIENKKDKLETMVDIGCDTFVHAEVDNINKICIDIGFSFFLEMSLSEAKAFLPKKINLLEKKKAVWEEEIEKIQKKIYDAMQMAKMLADFESNIKI